MTTITPDTNVLIRAVTKDDPRQAAEAERVMREADLIAVTLPALCEFVWVLERSRKMPASWVAQAIRKLVVAGRVITDRPAVEAGLAAMEAGGDFADAVIAFEGRRLGGEIFATFDRRASAVLGAAGQRTLFLK